MKRLRKKRKEARKVPLRKRLMRNRFLDAVEKELRESEVRAKENLMRSSRAATARMNARDTRLHLELMRANIANGKATTELPDYSPLSKAAVQMQRIGRKAVARREVLKFIALCINERIALLTPAGLRPDPELIELGKESTWDFTKKDSDP